MKHTVNLRRAVCMALLLMLVCMTWAPALASSSPSGAYVVTTAEAHDRLYVRSSPKGTVIDKLKKGTVVVYKYRKSGWWKVEYRGGSGYVYPGFLNSVANLSGAKYRSYDNLYVRNKPKTGAAVLGKLKTKLSVRIIGQKGTWVKITRSGAVGWVAAKYLYRYS